jgi:hypothetical protein
MNGRKARESGLRLKASVAPTAVVPEDFGGHIELSLMEMVLCPDLPSNATGETRKLAAILVGDAVRYGRLAGNADDVHVLAPQALHNDLTESTIAPLSGRAAEEDPLYEFGVPKAA